MTRLSDLDSRRALALLNAVAREPSRTAVLAFDEFFYPLIFAYVAKRHHTIGIEMGAKLSVGGSAAPHVPSTQVDEAAHVTALVALRRARASASQFDATLGSPIGWVLRAAGYAYLEVARQLAQDQGELLEDDEQDRPAPTALTDPAEILARQSEIDDLFLPLSDDERRVVNLVLRYKYTYAQAAEIVFGDAKATKRVDHLLQSARTKLARRWASTHQDDDR